jgi:O-antigen/teichoic acid export membrane protein
VGTGDDETDGLPRRFGFNLAANFSVPVAAGLATLLVTPFLLRELGAAAFGVWALAAGLVGYLELFGLSFRVATTKLIAEDAWTRPAEVTTTLNTSFFLLAGLGGVALVVGAVIAVLGLRSRS